MKNYRIPEKNFQVKSVKKDKEVDFKYIVFCP